MTDKTRGFVTQLLELLPTAKVYEDAAWKHRTNIYKPIEFLDDEQRSLVVAIFVRYNHGQDNFAVYYDFEIPPERHCDERDR